MFFASAPRKSIYAELRRPRTDLCTTLLITSLAQITLTATPWHSLCLPNGGYWPERITLTLTNPSATPLAGQPLRFTLAPLAATPVQALRVCRPDGVEFLFDLRAGNAAKRSGALDPTDELIVPVECAAHSTTNLFVYAGNNDAWAVPDYLPAKSAENAWRAGSSDIGLTIGPVEKLPLKPARPLALKPLPGWQGWAEIRVRRFAETAGAASLVRVNLRKTLACLPDAAWDSVLSVRAGDGAELSAYHLGQGMDLLFSANVSFLTEELFQVGFLPRSNSDATAALAAYGRLLASNADLAANGDFESGPGSDSWEKPPEGGAHQVKAGFSSDARFGKRALELTAANNAKGDWLGWRSREIPVHPGATYFLGGWLKGINLQAPAMIHAHFHDARGNLTTSGAMVSTQPAVNGESDWVNSKGFFQAPPDAATIQIHLTMNTQGTLRHDGVVLCEVADGEVVRVHSGTGNAAAPATGLQAWEVNPLVKVFPDTPPQEPARAVTIELARNEYQAFQLAMRSGVSPVRLNIAVSPLKNRAGVELPPVKIERVGFVPIDFPSAYYSTDVPEWCRKVPGGAGATDGWAGWWPDPLAPASSLELRPEQTQPAWFTVHAPKSAAPGDYEAVVTVGDNAKGALKLPLTVRVLPFALPDHGRLQAIFDFRFGPGGGFSSGADSKEDQRTWLRFIAEHRLGINEIRPEPKFSYKDGKVTMDAAEYDDMARFCFDELGMNVAYTPQFFYMFGWAYPPNKLFGLAPFTPEWTEAFRQAYRLFTEHVREKGWHDRFVYYISDEPHFQHEFVVEQMKKLCALIHEVDASIPIYSSTWRHCAAWDEALDLWGIGQYGCFPVPEMEGLQRAGKQMWFTCDGQMATDTPFLATERLLPYYCLKYGVRGFEFWGLAWWTYDPWQTGWHQFIRQSDEGKKYYWVRYPDGDGYLAYPGKPAGIDGPASTIRLEQIRQGLQDYEVLAMLGDLAAKARQAGRPAPYAERALAGASEVVSIPNAGGLRSTEILPDPGRVPAVRKAVNAALVRLMNQEAGR